MAITTMGADYAWRPDEVFFPPADVVGDALIMQTSTVAGSIDGDQPSVRVGYVVDTESADYVAEGGPISEDNPELAEVEVKTRKISRLVAVSNEQFRKDQTAGQLAASVSRDIIQKADAEYLGGADPAGLLAVQGTVNGGLVDENLDALVDLIAELESNGATPSAVILDPWGWGVVRKFKVGGSSTNESLLGAGTTDAAPMLLSLPVLRSRWIPPYSGVVVDRTQIVSAVGQVSVATSEHALFASDSVQLRATWRIGWGVVRPDRIGKFTLPGGGS